MLVHTGLLLLLAATPAVTFAPGSATATLLAETRISSAQARSIALQAVAGAVLADRLERAGTRWVYTFEIRPIHVERGDQVVQVDALDGTIVLHARKSDHTRRRSASSVTAQRRIPRSFRTRRRCDTMPP